MFSYLGRIIFTEKNETSDPYGLVVAYAAGGGIDSVNALKVLTTGGKYLEYNLKNEMRVNGQSKTSLETIEFLKSKAVASDGAGTIVLPVKYKTSGTTFTSLEVLTPEKAKGTYKYTSSGYSFSGNGTTFNAATSGTNATTFFVVPNNITKHNEYAKKSLSFFSNNGNYNVAAYDLAGTTAKLVVCYLTGGQTTAAKVYPATPVYLIEAVNDASNSEGQLVKKITYKNIAKEDASATILTSDDAAVIAKAASLNSGDLIKFVKENDEITVIETVFINGTTLTNETGTVKIAGYHIQKDDTSGDGYYQVVYGTVYNLDTDSNFLTIIPELYADSALDETNIISLSTNSPKYYKYSTKNSEFTLSSEGAVMKYFELKDNDPAKASRVVAVVSNQKVVGVYILGE